MGRSAFLIYPFIRGGNPLANILIIISVATSVTGVYLLPSSLLLISIPIFISSSSSTLIINIALDYWDYIIEDYLDRNRDWDWDWDWAIDNNLLNDTSNGNSEWPYLYFKRLGFRIFGDTLRGSLAHNYILLFTGQNNIIQIGIIILSISNIY